MKYSPRALYSKLCVVTTFKHVVMIVRPMRFVRIILCHITIAMASFVPLYIQSECYAHSNIRNIKSHLSHITKSFTSKSTPTTVNCVKTPMVFDKNPKPNIYMGNNLWRYVGSANFAEGIYIKIIGKVLDGDCVPISNAVIEIWQLDNNGYDSNYYTNLPTHNLTLTMQSMQKADKYFVGSGTAITDNLGRYTIYTIIPGTDSKRRVPHINFMVNHKNFTEFITQMYFPEHEYDVKNDEYIMKNIASQHDIQLLVATKKEAIDIQNIAAVAVYEFNITLTGSNKYRKY